MAPTSPFLTTGRRFHRKHTACPVARESQHLHYERDFSATVEVALIGRGSNSTPNQFLKKKILHC